jgi:ABC-type antimicrobial peptide transport system permease subunit
MIINITWVHKEEHNFTVIQQYQVFLVDLESYSIGNFGLEDIHLHSDLLQESEPDENGDADAVFMLSLIALLVLIIAWVNYINLSSSRALERAREVGIRKVVGAHRR